MVLYIQKYGMQTMNIMKQEKRASLPGGARRFGFVCSFSFEKSAARPISRKAGGLKHKVCYK